MTRIDDLADKLRDELTRHLREGNANGAFAVVSEWLEDETDDERRQAAIVVAEEMVARGKAHFAIVRAPRLFMFDVDGRRISFRVLITDWSPNHVDFTALSATSPDSWLSSPKIVGLLRGQGSRAGREGYAAIEEERGPRRSVRATFRTSSLRPPSVI